MQSTRVNWVLLILATVILSAYTGTLTHNPTDIFNPTPYPTYTPYPTPTDIPNPTPYPTPTLIPAPTATPSPAQVFTTMLYDRINHDPSLHPSIKQATANLLSLNEATIQFDGSSGQILQFKILDVPSDYEETNLVATQLIFTAFTVATKQQFLLNGIEVVFFSNNKPRLLFFNLSHRGNIAIYRFFSRRSMSRNRSKKTICLLRLNS